MQGLQQHRLMSHELVPDELFAWCVQALLFTASQPGARRD
jgi:hypothetical protein